MKRSTILVMLGLCTLGAGSLGAGTTSSPGPANAASLPPPGSRLVMGVLDPIHWRALPPSDRRFAEWEKWAINRRGQEPLFADVSGVRADADRLANKRVRAFGEIRHARAADGSRVRYFYVQTIESAR